MDIRPIRTEEDYEAAMAEFRGLWGAEEGTLEGDRLDVLATLIGVYEDQFVFPPSPPHVALRAFMEHKGLGQADLSRILGSRSHASEILNGKRSLSLAQIRKLHHAWRIPTDTLMGEPLAA
jgi:HTH-type transcriptional regulator/antitoxin HigA